MTPRRDEAWLGLGRDESSREARREGMALRAMAYVAAESRDPLKTFPQLDSGCLPHRL